MSRALRVFDLAFWPGRPQRSAAYKAGVLDVLLKRIDGIVEMPLPYQLGSAEADAYFAGEEEGKLLAEQLTGTGGRHETP